MIEHNTVQDRAYTTLKAKRNVTYPERGQHARQFVFDQADTLDGLYSWVRKFRISSRQGEGEGIENKIAYARQFYNETVLDFNNLITTIPGVWFAAGRNKHEFLEIPEEAREVPQVKF